MCEKSSYQIFLIFLDTCFSYFYIVFMYLQVLYQIISYILIFITRQKITHIWIFFSSSLPWSDPQKHPKNSEITIKKKKKKPGSFPLLGSHFISLFWSDIIQEKNGCPLFTSLCISMLTSSKVVTKTQAPLGSQRMMIPQELFLCIFTYGPRFCVSIL